VTQRRLDRLTGGRRARRDAAAPCADRVNPASGPERSGKHVTPGAPGWWTGTVTTDDEDQLGTLTPLRGIDLGEIRRRRSHRRQEPALWFITITVSGRRMDAEEVRRSLERLGEEQPFLVSASYASSRAEIKYWDESVDVEGAVAQALRLWRDHESSAGLPPWTVVGLEVVDRDTARRRWDTDTNLTVFGLGEIRPMEGVDH
jgi:hypothetical protein